MAFALVAACGGDSGSGQPPTLALLAGAAQEAGHTDGVGSEARFSGTSGVAADHAGNVYVVDGYYIRRITPAGVVTTLASFGPNTVVLLNGVAADDAGNVYVGYTNVCVALIDGVCATRGDIYRIDATSATSKVDVTNSSDGTGTVLGFVYDVALDRSGNLYIAQDLGGIRRLSPGGDLTTVASRSAISRPGSLAVDDAGNIYVVDGNVPAPPPFRIPISPRVSKVDSAGVVTTLVDAPGTASGNAARLTGPHGIAVDSQGNLYISDTVSHVVHKVTPSGATSIVVGTENVEGFVPGSLPGVLDAPRGVAVHASDLYIGMGTAIAVVRNRP